MVREQAAPRFPMPCGHAQLNLEQGSRAARTMRAPAGMSGARLVAGARPRARSRTTPALRRGRAIRGLNPNLAIILPGRTLERGQKLAGKRTRNLEAGLVITDADRADILLGDVAAP